MKRTLFAVGKYRVKAKKGKNPRNKRDMITPCDKRREEVLSDELEVSEDEEVLG